MKAEHYYKNDLRNGMRELFLKWWRGEEMTREDRIHYYSLKTDFCKSKSKDYTLLEMNACMQQTFYEYRLMGVNPPNFQPSQPTSHS
jgi:hypothetical protein